MSNEQSKAIDLGLKQGDAIDTIEELPALHERLQRVLARKPPQGVEDLWEFVVATGECFAAEHNPQA